VLLLQLAPLPDAAGVSDERMQEARTLRTKYLSYESATRSLGLVMGTVLSSAFAPFKWYIGSFVVDKYNSPGLVSLLLCIVNLALVIAYLRPSAWEAATSDNHTLAASSAPVPPSASTPLLKTLVVASGVSSASTLAPPLPPTSTPPPRDLVAVCLFVYFANVSVFSLFETISTPFLGEHLGWSVDTVALYFVACSALMLVLFLSLVPRVQKCFGIRPTLALGLCVAAAVRIAIEFCIV
jgi:hypothetical protein